jgi:cytochrome c-type biogenesis protein CcmH
VIYAYTLMRRTPPLMRRTPPLTRRTTPPTGPTTTRPVTLALVFAVLATIIVALAAPAQALAAPAQALAAPAQALAAPAQAHAPRASLPAVERRVMCVTCKIPLMVAQSPQANREREFIRGLIAEGDTQAQIERALVAQYGPAVLGLPAAHGFDLSAYLVPLAVLVGLLGLLAFLLPRWRRQARARAAASAPADSNGGGGLTAAERARLDADLARFER